LFVATVRAQSTTQIGIFSVNLDSFPVLQQDFGSVLLLVPGMQASFPKIIVTRVPGNKFDAVTSRCTHQGGPVGVYSPTLKALRCPNHGSQFAPDGKVLLGPAAQALTRYNTTFDGNKTIAVEIPGLGYSATIAAAAAPATGGSRRRLEFPTLTGLRYEVRFRASVSGRSWVQVPFATTPDGVVTQTVFTGTNSKATVYVEGSQQYGFFAVVRY
jgi:nitrite reductase/ring-hydroxylating ferredoxin subunit